MLHVQAGVMVTVHSCSKDFSYLDVYTMMLQNSGLCLPPPQVLEPNNTMLLDFVKPGIDSCWVPGIGPLSSNFQVCNRFL